MSQMKHCPRCQSEKPATAVFFHRNRARHDGFAAQCKECCAKIDKARNEKRVEYRSQMGKRWYRENRELRLIKNREWKKNNPDRVAAMNRKARAKRIKTDPVYRLSVSLSGQIRRSLGGKRGSASWEGIVGYSLGELKSHLVSQFSRGMSWKNYGALWEIDHIRPVVWFRAKPTATASEVETIVRECWSLENLRPLVSSENKKKGGRMLAREVAHVG